MKKFLVFISLLFCYICSCAQKEVTILVSGDGKTKTEAVDAALRSAIEQSFGAFVSSNTVILNDELVKDEIATVSSGNIKNYKEINYFEKDGKSYVTLNATVSIEKLVSYAQSKGSSCELNGATFTAEVRRIKFYQENTKIALQHLYEQLRALAPYVYDAELDAQAQVDGSVSFKITFFPNENMDKYEKLILSTLDAICVKNENEINNLKNLGVKLYKQKVRFIAPWFGSLGFDVGGYRDRNESYWEHEVVEKSILPNYCYDASSGEKWFYLYDSFNIDDTDLLLGSIRQFIIKDNLGNIIHPYFRENNTWGGHVANTPYCTNCPIVIPMRIKQSLRTMVFSELRTVSIKDYNKALLVKGGYGNDVYAKGFMVSYSTNYSLDNLTKVTGFTVERGEYKLENK